MAKWTLSTCGSVIVRDKHGDASASPNCTEQDRSRLEIGGREAIALLCFSTHGICESHSAALFPTRFADQTDPRGYLRTPLCLPADAASPHINRISYDGVALTLAGDGVCTFVFPSPSMPIVWVVSDYDTPQTVSPPTFNKLQSVSGHNVHRFSRWQGATRREFAFSCMPTVAARSAALDFAARTALVAEWTAPVTLTCDAKLICAAIRFAKIRMSEAVVQAAALGAVHSPGGGMFYAGVWCNDQAEYAAPILAAHGASGTPLREAALNSLLVLGARFSGRSVPYSVEMDGAFVGALDRGDAAMFAWGAALVVLTLCEDNARLAMVPYLHLCCKELIRRMEESGDGVVESQSDELEERFETGVANLSINCISILALEMGAEAARDFDQACADIYAAAARRLRAAVHAYFKVQGPRRYAYYKGCEDARGWACLAALARLPDGTDALRFVLSELWCDDGVLVSSKETDVWDRCTLYAIRASFIAGDVESAALKLSEFVNGRFVNGVAVPYSVECNSSWAQLSAESALLVRVVTEGLLGIVPRCGNVISFMPSCPECWGAYNVDGVRFGGVMFCFRVELSEGGITVHVSAADREARVVCALGDTLLLEVMDDGEIELKVGASLDV